MEFSKTVQAIIDDVLAECENVTFTLAERVEALLIDLTDVECLWVGCRALLKLDNYDTVRLLRSDIKLSSPDGLEEVGQDLMHLATKKFDYRSMLMILSQLHKLDAFACLCLLRNECGATTLEGVLSVVDQLDESAISFSA